WPPGDPASCTICVPIPEPRSSPGPAGSGRPSREPRTSSALTTRIAASTVKACGSCCGTSSELPGAPTTMGTPSTGPWPTSGAPEYVVAVVSAPVRVGVIGRGFGARIVAPVFEETEGCEVVDVVSPRDDDAVRALCSRADVGVVAVHSPPFCHRDLVLRALDA